MASSWPHMAPRRTPKLVHVQPSQAYEVRLWKRVKLLRAKTELLSGGRSGPAPFWLSICPADFYLSIYLSIYLTCHQISLDRCWAYQRPEQRFLFLGGDLNFTDHGKPPMRIADPDPAVYSVSAHCVCTTAES